MEEAVKLLKLDLPLSDSAPGGQIAYRKSLTISFFYKFFVTVKRKLLMMNVRYCLTICSVPLPASSLFNYLSTYRYIQGADMDQSLKSATEPLERQTIQGAQVFQPRSEDEQAGDCGRPLPHKSAGLQCSGEAQYVDDLPKYQGLSQLSQL